MKLKHNLFFIILILCEIAVAQEFRVNPNKTIQYILYDSSQAYYIEPNQVLAFQNNVAAVQVGEMWHLIDTLGKKHFQKSHHHIIKPSKDFFIACRARLNSNERMKYEYEIVDYYGYLLGCEAFTAYGLYDDYCVAYKNAKYYYLKDSIKVLIPEDSSSNDNPEFYSLNSKLQNELKQYNFYQQNDMISNATTFDSSYQLKIMNEDHSTYSFYSYIHDNLKFSNDCINSSYYHRMFIRLIIEKDGSIQFVELLRGENKPCVDLKYLSLFVKSPNLVPVIYNGKAVRASLIVPIKSHSH